jgi:hypothetical protein
VDGLAAQIIAEYMEENLFAPSANWPADEFARRSCERWAAWELLELVRTRTEEPPARVIDGFRRKMDGYARQAEDHPTDFLFSTARDTAEAVLYLFL